MSKEFKDLLVPLIIGMLLSSIGSSYRKSQEIKEQQVVIEQLENKVLEMENE